MSTRVPGKGAGWAHMYLAESRRGRHSRKMPTSDWESVRQLRGDALWKDADQVLLTRAMLRGGLAAGGVASPQPIRMPPTAAAMKAFVIFMEIPSS